jgi:hypothetical protein
MAETRRVTNGERAFPTAYEGIKPSSSGFIGSYLAAKDEVFENAERVHLPLVGA